MKEIVLHVEPYHLESSTSTKSEAGKWFVSFGPVFEFGQMLQVECEKIKAPSLQDSVLFSFENIDGTRWAEHEDLIAKSDDFWKTTWDDRGVTKPRFESHKAWMISRAWLKCRASCARYHHPETLAMQTAEQMMANIRIRRPSPLKRAFAMLHDQFGFPRVVRLTYDVRLQVV